MTAKANSNSLSSLVNSAHTRQRVTGFTHDFYNYPARFSPVLIREIISNFSNEGDLILDPFMGGGTTLIEAKLLNRDSIGFDISTLSSFLAKVKSNPLKTDRFDYFDKWFYETITKLSCHSRFPRPESWIEKGYQRNLDAREVWPIRKLIEQFLYELSLLKNVKHEKDFIRCVILKTGQWALDSKKVIPSSNEFKAKLIANYHHLCNGSNEFWNENPSANAMIISSSADAIHKHAHLFKTPPKLVLTSPPYPGIHVVYHRWQVFGKRETPAPFWIANSQDGHGLTHYAMGGRKQKGLIDYFQNIKSSFESIRQVCDHNTTVIQILAFSEIKWQLPKYLETMGEAGFEEIRSENKRIWREVPNRKWYAQQKGKTSSSKEVILFHKVK
jgi:DNA modification methylase